MSVALTRFGDRPICLSVKFYDKSRALTHLFAWKLETMCPAVNL